MNPLRNEDAESAVLGSIILDESKLALNKAREILSSDDFDPHKGAIFEAVCKLLDIGKSIDIITLFDYFKNDKFINREYIMNMINSVPSAANIEHYVNIVNDCSMRRRQILLLDERKRKLLEGENPEDVISSGMVADMNLINKDKRSKICHIKDIVNETFWDIEKRINREFLGIPTGIKPLDLLTGGILNDCLTVIAGRPGSGKTTFTQQIVLNLAKNNPGMFASLEMSGKRLGVKMFASETGINSRSIDTPKKLDDVQWKKLGNALNDLSERSLYIDDSIEMRASQIAIRARKLKYEVDIKYLVVDYLQIVHPEETKRYENRREEINNSLRIFKNLARELDINVIVLSQILRDIEKRECKKPSLADLKESGAIEEMSDIIMFLYKDNESENKTEQLNKEDWYITPVNIAKNKYGPADVTFDLIFRKDISKFFEINLTN